ncbi:ATP-binding protein [Jeotgalibacillus sp. S-D1]|uniref:ATP-binding protein n=1 Tax=Jeotgalibacillus sp. S-D1 TaxID=2552189 RepID=UPI0010599BF2|nr:ATP-binding protein [Jeotgalibacillus sp. S-D1]TDL31860.1 ATP-binding protein [Jeotgalibacillus sp. S-D1]
MKTIQEIMLLISHLDTHIADDFEGQDLDFKQWSTRALEDNVNKMIQYAVCMANGGGGSVVFGIADKVVGYRNTILGVPLHLDIAAFKKKVLEETIPSIEPEFNHVKVRYGTGELLIMTVQASETVHTFTDGRAVVRKEKECLPIDFAD